MTGADRYGHWAARLPCGRAVDDLMAQVTDGGAPVEGEHQRRCAHCTAARAELEALWQPVRALAAERVRAPSEVLQGVMARVRELMEPGWYAVVSEPEGKTRIAARVLGAYARLAAEEVSGVTLAIGGGRTGESTSAAEIAGDPGEAASNVGVAGAHVVVDVDVVVQMGVSISAVGREVQERIADRIAAYTGLTTHQVRVTVVDVVRGHTEGPVAGGGAAGQA